MQIRLQHKTISEGMPPSSKQNSPLSERILTMSKPTESPTSPTEFVGICTSQTNWEKVPDPVNKTKQKYLEDMEATEEHLKQEEIERAKHVFHCFDNLTFPTYKDFCLQDKAEVALGYGGSAKQLGFKSAAVATYITETFPFKTDIKTGILYFYNAKTWLANAEPYLEYLVNKILCEETKLGHYKNIEFVVKTQTYQTIEFSQKLALENGLLDVETLEFKEYSDDTKNEMPFHYIPVKYDPTATCPQWEEFVKEVITADDIPTLQEWSGYLFLPDYRFHKLMWIVGSGRNGKGVWQRTQETLLGYSNVSHVGLEEFDGNHRFGLIQLHSKLFNPCSEPQTNKVLQTNLLKYATGQDVIEAELKGSNKRLAFTNTSKITILANKFPRVNDQTVAFRERRLFLNFPNQFLGKEVIANIEKNWLQGEHDERSGILNWCLTGLQRLLCNGIFTTSKTQAETELDFLRASDSISAFINETATYDKTLLTSIEDVKTAYNSYCDFYGLDVENEKRLAVKLSDLPHVKHTAKRIEGIQHKVWEGVNFKILKEIDENNPKEVGQTKLSVKTVTAVTAVTPITLPDISHEKSIKIEERETGVTGVTPVTTSKPVSNNTKTMDSKTVFFERLASNDVHKCDGLVKGHDCGFEAQFKTPDSFYCKSCLTRIGKDCYSNGFLLVERNQPETENLDGEGF